MGNAAGVRRDFAGLERRRMTAAKLLKQGVSQSEVARRLGVHRQSVIRWARQLAHAGRAGLKQAGRAGRKPKLSASQLRKIEQALKRGPEALGYASGLWTAGRVRELIEDQCASFVCSRQPSSRSRAAASLKSVFSNPSVILATIGASFDLASSGRSR
jgi:transposase